MVEAERKVISEAGGEGSDAGEVLAGLTKEEKKKAIKQKAEWINAQHEKLKKHGPTGNNFS